MAKIYTRRGDGGETGAADGRRERKDSLRVETNGTIDELNSTIGLARAVLGGDDAELAEMLAAVQNDLFLVGGHVARGKASGGEPVVVAPADVTRLEACIDRAQAEVGPLRGFILPGGTPVAAHLHVARTVCRRAERRLVSLAESRPISGDVLAYVNRLSDLLFMLARLANKRAGQPDTARDPP